MRLRLCIYMFDKFADLLFLLVDGRCSRLGGVTGRLPRLCHLAKLLHVSLVECLF